MNPLMFSIAQLLLGERNSTMMLCSQRILGSGYIIFFSGIIIYFK